MFPIRGNISVPSWIQPITYKTKAYFTALEERISTSGSRLKHKQQQQNKQTTRPPAPLFFGAEISFQTQSEKRRARAK